MYQFVKHKSVYLLLALFLISVSCALNIESPAGESNTPAREHPLLRTDSTGKSAAQGGSWDLVWSDEFNYSGLPDPAKWGYDVGGGGWGNRELQYYTANRLENARVENGKLIITCRKENWEGKDYTSARLVTREKGDWLYGKVEVRAKLPTGKGTWPAIWMLPTDWEYGGWPNSGELDIMEHVGYDQNTIHQTIHTGSYNHTKGTQKAGKKYISTASAEFHTYSMEWFPEKVDFFIDGALVFSFANEYKSYMEWPYDKRFHLILNIAFGGDWGGAMGIDPACLPQSMEVEYVRVFKQGALQSHPVPGVVPAAEYSAAQGIQLEECSEGGRNVGWIDAGDTLTYRVQVAQAGKYRAEYRVAGWENGSFQLKSGSSVLDRVSVPNTGAYQSWSTARGGETFNLAAGEQDLVITAAAGGWNLLKFELIRMDNPVTYSLTLWPAGETGGAGNYEQNSVVPIKYTGTGTFVRWTGDTAAVADVNSSQTTVTMSGNITLTAEVAGGEDEVILVEAEQFSAQSGIQTESCSEGGLNVGWLDNGDWIDYRVTVQGGTYTVQYRVASWTTSAALQILADGKDAGTVVIPSTGGYQSWATVENRVTLAAGTHTLRLQVPGPGWNINWLKLTKSGGSTAVKVEAEDFTRMLGIQLEECAEGTRNIGWVDAGDWVEYQVNVPASAGGSYTVTYRAASQMEGGVIQLQVNSSVKASTAIGSTGGWQSYQDKTAVVTLSPGQQTIRLYAPSGPWNLNYFTIKAK